MTAMKCDRCGQLYETYFNADARLIEKNANGMCFTHKVVSNSGITTFKKDQYDLCPSCMDKLIKFMLYDGGICKNVE